MEENTSLYDDDNAIKFIKNQLPQELKERITDDEINYVIDIIYDYYESQGLMEAGDDDGLVEINEDEVVNYVFKNVKKDKVFKLSQSEITFLVQGEFGYCESIGLFDA